MADTCPVVLIRTPTGPARLNESDFDPAKHVLWQDEASVKPEGALIALDHDRDGGAGGSLPAAERNVDDLRAKAEAAGVKVDMRWGAARLQLEIDRANHK